MMPRIEARRELASINAMAAAFGGMRPLDRNRYMSDLQRQARGASPLAKPSPARLAAIGVGVVVVPAEQERSDG